ncbi:MAG: hypothetical protein FVQ81_02995 [Candidatus Glassbacteria bacterium]|nr:hypothetical protein [Candidatus Glassbacteria bacterium]
MKLTLRLASCALLILSLNLFPGCSPTGDSPAEPGEVTGHPRLILSGDFLEQVRESCKGRSSGAYQALAAQVDGFIDNQPVDSIPVRQQGRLARQCGLLYLLSGNRKYLDAGERYLANALERYLELEREHGGGYWEAVEFRKYCCFAWDWLYNGLSEQKRREFGRKILEAGELAWNRKWFTPYGGGGYATLDPVFWPAMTLRHSGIADSTAEEWSGWVKEHIYEWRKMQGQVASDDGGMYSGLGYAAYNYLRTPVFIFESWKSITGEDLTENNPYLEHFSLWWTYCEKPNGEWPRIDDTGSVLGSIQPWHFKYLACRYRDRVALWQLSKRDDSGHLTAWDVVWDPSGLGIEPQGPDDSWPLGRHFEGTGWVVLRSGWDSTAAYSVFDCGDFYYGHQHPAENAFTIFRGGSLAINSGRYEWGSDHRPNYMVRTIASNSVLVYDPQELFISRNDTLSNDGGQKWPRPGRNEFGETAGTQWDTGQITAFETNQYYTYVCGDATASYSEHKLEKFTRQYLHIQPDIFVVFDRVESTRPEYRKYWLLHTVNEPVKRSGWLAADERRGRLYLRAILPANAVIDKIGGEGKEFWVFGKNHPPGMTHYQQRDGEQWGSWRVQVSAGKPVRQAEFLNVLYAAMDGDDTPPEVQPLDPVSSRPGLEISHKQKIYNILFDATGAPGGDIVVMDSARNTLLEKRLTTAVQPQQGIGR